MASVRYRVKTKKGFNSIYLRFKEGNSFDIELSTGKKAEKGKWSAAKQKHNASIHIKHAALNEDLNNLKNAILTNYENTKDSSALINSKWLKAEIQKYFNREDKEDEENIFYLTSFVEKFIKQSENRLTKKGTLVSKRTIQHYSTTLKKIRDFEEFIGHRVLLKYIDIKFHGMFLAFLIDEQNLNNNSAGGYIDNIRLFCKAAERKGLEVNKEYKYDEFRSPSNKTEDVYLNELEIEKIVNATMPSDYLKNAQEWLIIGLRTGLRVSDLLRLNKSFVDDGFIQLRTKKTSYPVIIPIHPQVLEVLVANDGNFPRKISDQKFNEYIKKVCFNSGITDEVKGAKLIDINEGKKEKPVFRKRVKNFPKHELISSHTCRRSFATNLYGKFDTMAIMKITGHRSEKQFLDYIKITPKEYAERLKAFWNNTFC
jgi:integrase